MKIMIFLHGTVIMHRSATGQSREERVNQVRSREDPSLRDFASYVPVGGAVAKLGSWQKQGAEILYLSSHRSEVDVAKDRQVLARHRFPSGKVFFRGQGDSYATIVERIVPEVFIEDDCESIGGRGEMVSPFIRPDVASRIRIIVVREFGGIDSLPDDLPGLMGSEAKWTSD